MDHVMKLRLRWLLEDLESADKINRSLQEDFKTKGEHFEPISVGVEIGNNGYQNCIKKLRNLLAEQDSYLEEDVDLSGGVEIA